MEIKILGSYIKNYGIANYMIYFVVFDNILFLGGGLGVGVNVNSFKMVFKDEIMFLNSRLLIFFPLIWIPNHPCWFWINPTNERCLCIKCTFYLLIWVNYGPENEFTNVPAGWVCLGLLRVGCWQWKEFGHHVPYIEC